MTSLWAWLGLMLVWTVAVVAVLAVGEIRTVRRERR